MQPAKENPLVLFTIAQQLNSSVKATRAWKAEKRNAVMAEA